jgi:hypothetical protein
LYLAAIELRFPIMLMPFPCHINPFAGSLLFHEQCWLADPVKHSQYSLWFPCWYDDVTQIRDNRTVATVYHPWNRVQLVLWMIHKLANIQGLWIICDYRHLRCLCEYVVPVLQYNLLVHEEPTYIHLKILYFTSNPSALLAPSISIIDTRHYHHAGW